MILSAGLRMNYLNEQIEKSGKIKQWLQEKILNQK